MESLYQKSVEKLQKWFRGVLVRKRLMGTRHRIKQLESSSLDHSGFQVYDRYGIGEDYFELATMESLIKLLTQNVVFYQYQIFKSSRIEIEVITSTQRNSKLECSDKEESKTSNFSNNSLEADKESENHDQISINLSKKSSQLCEDSDSYKESQNYSKGAYTTNNHSDIKKNSTELNSSYSSECEKPRIKPDKKETLAEITSSASALTKPIILPEILKPNDPFTLKIKLDMQKNPSTISPKLQKPEGFKKKLNDAISKFKINPEDLVPPLIRRPNNHPNRKISTDALEKDRKSMVNEFGQRVLKFTKSKANGIHIKTEFKHELGCSERNLGIVSIAPTLTAKSTFRKKTHIKSSTSPYASSWTRKQLLNYHNIILYVDPSSTVPKFKIVKLRRPSIKNKPISLHKHLKP